MALPDYPDARRTALFLDFDGTLVDIVARPDAVAVTEATRTAIATIAEYTDGALAIVTGRDIATIDAFVAPLRLPIAGVHGFTRRDAMGKVQMPEIDGELLDKLKEGLNLLCGEHEGLLLEEKAGSVALHFRARPELEDACIAAMERIVDGAGGFRVSRGKMVVEARPEGANKGAAVTAFMSEAPFAGRVPLFAGDDVTDEDAFETVNAVGGISIKVGEGVTAAAFRAPTTAAFVAWLVDYAQHLEGGEDRERS